MCYPVSEAYDESVPASQVSICFPLRVPVRAIPLVGTTYRLSMLERQSIKRKQDWDGVPFTLGNIHHIPFVR